MHRKNYDFILNSNFFRFKQTKGADCIMAVSIVHLPKTKIVLIGPRNLEI